MKTNKKWVGVLALVIAVVGLTGCENPVTSLTGNLEKSVIGEGSGAGELVSKEQKTFEATAFDSVHISAQAMAIVVTRSSGNNAEVELLADKAISSQFTFDASVKAKVLNVKVEENGKKFNLSDDQRGERKLLISLPDKLYEQVTIKNNFGRIEAADLNANGVKIDLDAGEIRMSRVLGTMNLEAKSGAIFVDGIRLEKDLTAKTDVGEIAIHLNESPRNAEISLKSEIGNVRADLDDIQFDANASNKKTGAIGSKGPRLNASTNVGSIEVDAN